MELLNSNSSFPIRIRCHAKAHKCVELAKLQKSLLGDFFSGVCCQTVTETEAMAFGGIDNILLTNEIASSTKARRIVVIHNRFVKENALLDSSSPAHINENEERSQKGKGKETAKEKKEIGVIVDSLEVAQIYLDALKVEKSVAPLKVLIEVNVGVPRGGVDSIAAFISLAKCTLLRFFFTLQLYSIFKFEYYLYFRLLVRNRCPNPNLTSTPDLLNRPVRQYPQPSTLPSPQPFLLLHRSSLSLIVSHFIPLSLTFRI